MSEHGRVAKAAGVVGSATLLSRVLGLVRDLVTAYFFGAEMAADAFFVAFRIPNLLRRLLAEGALTVAFIPIFTEYLQKQGRARAFALSQAATGLFSLVLFGVTVLGVVFAPYIVSAFAPGFMGDPDKFALTVLLTRVMFPYIFLIGLVALAMGVLNSLNRFAAPALSPVFLNIGIIAAVFLLANRLHPPVMALAVGVIAGGVMQVLLQIPSLAKEKGLLGISFNFRHPALGRIARLMAPAAVGAAVYQFSIFISTLLASFLAQGSVSYLYYADRIMQFPLGIFAVALSTAILPTMSRQAARADMEGLRDSLAFGLRLVFFVSIPATVGLIVLNEQIVALLFQRGRFDPQATAATAEALTAYALGLCALSGTTIVVRVFYALQDTKTPVKAAAVSLTCGALLSVILMGPLAHMGLALASSIASALNLIILTRVLRRRLGRLGGRDVAASAIKNLAYAALMAAAVYFIAGRMDHAQAGSSALLFRVLSAVAVGLGIYLALAWLMGSPEMRGLIGAISRRFKKNSTAG